jgi:hypothetical protein
MESLQGDELRCFAEQRCISKPELVAVLERLRAFQRQAQQHFSRAYLRTTPS